MIPITIGIIFEVYCLQMNMATVADRRILMSQLLICKSKCDLSRYGQKIAPESIISRSLIYDVIRKYFKDPSDDLWYIDTIQDLITDVENNIDTIMKIAESSEAMVFWYSDMFDELDEVDDLISLKNSILNVVSSDAPELYIHAIFE